MLDTNICIYIIKKKPAQVLQRLRGTIISDVAISTITLSELECGVHKSEKKDQNKFALAQFLVPLEIIAFDALAAQHYGQIRSSLESEGQPIGTLDLLIAAHARSLNSTLVTNNEREFMQIPNLSIQNWAKHR